MPQHIVFISYNIKASMPQHKL